MEPFYMNCAICKSRFRYGPHIYKGQHIATYKFTACKMCFEMAKDGWPSTRPA